MISLQRSSVQSEMAFSESISTVNLSFSTIHIIFDRLLGKVVLFEKRAGHFRPHFFASSIRFNVLSLATLNTAVFSWSHFLREVSGISRTRR